MPADEPMGSSPPVVEAQAEGDTVEDTEMTGEARPAKRVREPSVLGPKARARDQYCSVGDCWKQLGS